MHLNPTESGFLLNFLLTCFVLWLGMMAGKEVRQTKGQIMAKLSALAGQLQAIGSQLTKAKAEIVDEIAALKAALGDVDIPAEAQAALDNLAALAADLDAMNPDQPVEPPPPAG